MDALDFLLVIAQWGSQCQGHGGCEADITGKEPNVPDGHVNGLDLIMLFEQWGSPGDCVPPR